MQAGLSGMFRIGTRTPSCTNSRCSRLAPMPRTLFQAGTSLSGRHSPCSILRRRSIARPTSRRQFHCSIRSAGKTRRRRQALCSRSSLRSRVARAFRTCCSRCSGAAAAGISLRCTHNRCSTRSLRSIARRTIRTLTRCNIVCTGKARLRKSALSGTPARGSIAALRCRRCRWRCLSLLTGTSRTGTRIPSCTRFPSSTAIPRFRTQCCCS